MYLAVSGFIFCFPWMSPFVVNGRISCSLMALENSPPLLSCLDGVKPSLDKLQRALPQSWKRGCFSCDRAAHTQHEAN